MSDGSQCLSSLSHEQLKKHTTATQQQHKKLPLQFTYDLFNCHTTKEGRRSDSHFIILRC